MKCLVFASDSGGINSTILQQCFEYMDSIDLFDCSVAKPVVVCDGHESRMGIEFMKYIVSEETRWYVGGPKSLG